MYETIIFELSCDIVAIAFLVLALLKSFVLSESDAGSSTGVSDHL